MKKNLIILFALSVLLSCEQYPEPGNQTLEMFNYQLTGNNQYGKAGEYLDLEIGSTVYYESQINKKAEKFHTEFTVETGGGVLDNTTVEADSNSKMTTRWKLGDEKNQQTVKGKIFDADGRYYSEFTINANAFFPDKWNTITTGFLVGIQDMVTDTVNYRSLMISGMDLYKKEGTEGMFYEWEQIQSYSYQYNLKEIEINSKGEVFGVGWDGNLYKTIDWGLNWITLGKAIPGNTNAYQLCISKDDNIWVSEWKYGVYCSKDNGLSWTKDTIGLDDQEEVINVFYFLGNSHLTLSHNRNVIIRTDDDGITWYPIKTPEYTLSMFVTDENAIIAQGQEGGFTLYKSIDSGETYKKVFSPYVAYGTTSWHCYQKFRDFYYVLAPGGGVWKTKDFEDFEELVTFSLQRNLFIDHQGTIYASGFNYSNAAPDPTLVLPGHE